MTACIVGWAHTAFGRLEGETVESLIVRVATAALADAGVAAATSTRSCSATSTPASRRRIYRRAGAAGLARPALQARDPGRERLRHRLGRRAPGVEFDRRQGRAHRAGGGAEQMTTTPAPEIGRNLLKASYVREEADTTAASPASSPDRRSLFPALGRPVGRAGAHRRQEPQERRRQSVRADPQGPATISAATESDKNPRVAGPLKRTDCSLVSDGAAAVVLADVTTALRLGKAVALGRRARAGFPADVEARRAQARSCCARLETRAGGRRRRAHRPVVRRPMIASRSPS